MPKTKHPTKRGTHAQAHHTSNEVHVGTGGSKKVSRFSSKWLALVVVLAFGALGSYLIFASHAATPGSGVLYQMKYTKGPATSDFDTITLSKVQSQEKVGWAVIGQYPFINEPGSDPIAVYEGHQTGTNNNYYTTNKAKIPSQYTYEGIIFYESSSAKVPYGFCRSTASGFKLDLPCTTNPAPVTCTAITGGKKCSDGTITCDSGYTKSGSSCVQNPTPPKPTVSHDPEGFIDGCTYTNGQTVFEGWASDTDTPKGSQPLVDFTLTYGSNATLSVQAPTDLVYREATIDQYINANYPGQATTGTYGWQVSIKDLYKGTVYKPTGTVINVGEGANKALSVNTTQNVVATTTPLSYFAAGIVPDACLAKVPTGGVTAPPTLAGGGSKIPTPTPPVTSTPPSKPAPKQQNSSEPKPGTTGYLMAGQNLTDDTYLISTDKSYKLKLQSNGDLVILNSKTNRVVWHNNKVGKGGVKLSFLKDGNLVLYNKANKAVWQTGAHKDAVAARIGDEGYLDLLSAADNKGNRTVLWTTKGDKADTNLENFKVVAYSGYNDGCGGTATHYAANKTTHVTQTNFGPNSVCVCNTGKVIPYGKDGTPMMDSSVIKQCDRSASHRGSGSGGGTSNSQCNCGDPCGITHPDSCVDNCGNDGQKNLGGKSSDGKCICFSNGHTYTANNEGSACKKDPKAKCTAMTGGEVCNGAIICNQGWGLTYNGSPHCEKLSGKKQGNPTPKKCTAVYGGQVCNGSLICNTSAGFHLIYNGTPQCAKTPAKGKSTSGSNTCNKHDSFGDGCHDPSNHNCGANGQYELNGANGCGCVHGYTGTYCENPPKSKISCSSPGETVRIILNGKTVGTRCNYNGSVHCDKGYEVAYYGSSLTCVSKSGSGSGRSTKSDPTCYSKGGAVGDITDGFGNVLEKGVCVVPASKGQQQLGDYDNYYKCRDKPYVSGNAWDCHITGNLKT